MGEAKRRKQALGERYGKTPPVLIKGSDTLQKQTEKFADAYFAKFEQLTDARPADASLEDEQEATASDFQLLQDAEILEMQQWVQEYFELYRPKDREQLVMGLLEPFYFAVFKAYKEETEEDMEAYFASLVGSLTSLKILRSYLSEARLEEYTEPMRSLYWNMLDKLEDEELDTEDIISSARNLTQLFQACLNEEDIPEYLSS